MIRVVYISWPKSIFQADQNFQADHNCQVSMHHLMGKKINRRKFTLFIHIDSRKITEPSYSKVMSIKVNLLENLFLKSASNS